MEGREQSEQRREFLDRCFEYLKHMATLGTAAALLILAIYREQPFRLLLLAETLTLFALCVVISVYGMGVIALDGRRSSRRISQKTRDGLITLLTLFSGTFFMASVVALAVYLLGVPYRLQIAVPLVGIAVLSLLILYIYYASRPKKGNAERTVPRSNRGRGTGLGPSALRRVVTTISNYKHSFSRISIQHHNM